MAGERIGVLWAVKGLGPGGAERLLVSFARGADHSRFSFHVAYLLSWKDHLVGELASHRVPSTCLSGGHRGGDPRWIVQLPRLVVGHRFDVVHFHSPLVATFGRPFLRLLPHRPAIVTTEHNVWSSYRVPTRVLNRLTAGLDDATLAVSEEVRASLPPHRRARTEVVLPGVDVDRLAARRRERTDARRELGLSDDEVVIVTVANLRSGKDYPTLLAAARLLRDRGSGARFLSVGQGWLADELEARRDQLGLGDSFRFLGYQADPIRVLAAADIFCLSSRHEGLPIALLEAMALGLPVVATAVGGIPSVVSEGVEGRLVAAGDAGGLADAIGELCDAEHRTRFGQASARRAGAFRMESGHERQQALYEELAARRRGARLSGSRPA